jgi:hypothetical protein
LARNRYGWQKRAKEIARKQKNDDKMKRRQGKIITLSDEEMPGTSEEGLEEGMESLGETDSVETELPAGSPQPD